MRPDTQYRGELSDAQITEGIAVAQANALRLIDDAKLLFEHERYPSSVALGVLAIEERGKVNILKTIALYSDPADIKKGWQEYRNHRSKNSGWIMPILVKEGARTALALREATNAKGEHTGQMDRVKQKCIYTDCYDPGVWLTPEQVGTRELAEGTLHLASFMWCSKEVSLREIELWRNIVRPHWNQPSMLSALFEWQAAMVAEGLSDTRVESLRSFMEGIPVEVQPAP